MSDWASSASEDDKNMSRSKKIEELLHRHPMAVRFRKPARKGLFGRLRWTVFTLLCFTAYGQPGMEALWAAFRLEEEGDESLWKEAVDILTGRMNNLVVVGSLLLATSSVFITTLPPIPGLVNYTLRGPYICIVSAFGLLIGGIISAAADSAAFSQAWPYWTENVCYRNRACVYGTTMAIAGPTISIANATILLAFGMLSAVWWAEDRGMKVFTVAFLLISVSAAFYCAVVFITAGPPLLRLRRGTADVFYTPAASQIRPTSTELRLISVASPSPTPDTDPPP